MPCGLSWRRIQRPRRLVPVASQYLRFGSSPRGGQCLLLAGKVRALTQGRFNVSFDDIEAVAMPAMRHRLILNFEAEAEGIYHRPGDRANPEGRSPRRGRGGVNRPPVERRDQDDLAPQTYGNYIAVREAGANERRHEPTPLGLRFDSIERPVDPRTFAAPGTVPAPWPRGGPKAPPAVNGGSRARGQSVEFADYRNYTAGDDFRYSGLRTSTGGWNGCSSNCMRRSAELPVRIFLDSSESMTFGVSRARF